MSETLTEATADHSDAAHAHPSDWAYVKIALILGAITALEVATYFESAITIFQNNSFVIFSLLFMMIVKFWMVAAYFMHLKSDNKIFTQLFVGGIVLATVVYIIALSAFEFWA